MQIRLSLRKGELEVLYERLRQAYAQGQLRLIKRIHALLSIIDGKTVSEVAEAFKLITETKISILQRMSAK